MTNFKAGAPVLVFSFFAMIAAAIVGAIIGGASHPIAGTLIGGAVGYMTPSLLAHFLRKRRRAAAKTLQTSSTGLGAFWLLLAGVATNEWVTDFNRDLVQALRGVTVAGMFGLICGTLAAWAIAGATLLPVLAGATGGAVLAYVLVARFEF